MRDEEEGSDQPLPSATPGAGYPIRADRRCRGPAIRLRTSTRLNMTSKVLSFLLLLAFTLIHTLLLLCHPP